MFSAVILAAALAIPGHFALQGGTPSTTSTLEVTPSAAGAHLDFSMQHAGRTLLAYNVDMTKKLHVIIISDDFSTFYHVHPVLGPDGHFTIDTKVPNGSYRVYADGVPTGFSQQVFRYDVGAQSPPPLLRPSSSTVAAGPYTVSLDTARLTAGSEAIVHLTIRKNGKLATDLHPYLGAAGHAVFINAADDTYVHVHPMKAGASMGDMKMGDMKMDDMHGMDMSGTQMGNVAGPKLLLHVELKEAGTYKLWFQFRGGAELYVAPFVLTAR